MRIRKPVLDSAANDASTDNSYLHVAGETPIPQKPTSIG
jgi:hypothetical protein